MHLKIRLLGQQYMTKMILEEMDPEGLKEAEAKAEKLAMEGLKKKESDIDLKILILYKLSRVRLEKTTQSLVYKYILKEKEIDPLTKTGKENVKRAIEELREIGMKIEEKEI